MTSGQPIIPRARAKELGSQFYFTGVPCVNGHVEQRKVYRCRCLGCLRDTSQKYAKAHPERRRASSTASGRKKLGPGAMPTRLCPEFCEVPNCGRSATHLNHDHITGLFRGWVYRRCNTGIGMLRDNAAGVRDALAYLERT